MKLKVIGKEILRLMKPETKPAISASMEEELYEKFMNDTTVKTNLEVEIRPTLIQNFPREVSLIFKKDGKVMKQEFPSVELATDFCLESFNKKPILFEHGFIVGKNGYEE